MEAQKDSRLYESIPPLQNHFSVKLTRYHQGSVMPHWHEHLELLYFLDGSCTVTLDGQSYAVGAGDLVVVNGSQIHSMRSEGGAVTYYCALVYPSFFSDVDTAGAVFGNLICRDPFVTSCFEEMFCEQGAGLPGADMMQKSHMYRLTAHLLRHYAVTPPSEQDQRNRSFLRARFHSVELYVAKHYAERITTRQLADMCYLSEGHFCHIFRAATGKSAMAYVNEYRIGRACTLLRRTEDGITQIAAQTGFEDVNYFSRTFRRLTGQSPSAYRHQST